MSDLKFACPKCGRHLAVDAVSAGLQINCPDCGQAIIIPSAAAAIPAEPGRHRSPLRLTAIIVGSLLVLAALTVGGLLLRGKSAAKPGIARSAAKLEAIRKAGEPASGAELNAWYEQPPPGENAAELFAAGFDLARLSAQDMNSATFPLLGKGKLPPPEQPLPPAMKKAIGEFLVRNRPALEKFEQGAKLSKSRYPLGFKEGPSMQIKHVIQLKRAIQIAQLSAVYEADQKHPEPACQAVRLALALARSLENEPLLVSQLVRGAGLAIAQKAAESVVNRLALSPDQLADLQRAFALAADTNGMTRAMIGERAMSIDLLRLPPEKLAQDLGLAGQTDAAELKKAGRQAFDRDLDFALDYYAYLVDTSRKPLAERQRAAGQCERRLGEARQQKLLLATMLLPAVSGAVKLGSPGLDAARVAQTALAVERYRAANDGRLPAALADLCPS